jgi:MFS family permease
MVHRRAEHPDPDRVQQRTVRVLVAAQVLGGAAIGAGAAVSPLLAKEILGGDDTFAGLAFAALTFGSALAAVPLSRLMSRRGRRPGLVRGYITAAIGAGAAVIAAEIESFPLLLAGMVLLGSGTAANLLARYAGADLAAPEHRARAISTVVWATTIGAVAGPNALGPTSRLGDWIGLPSLAGPFVVALVWFAVAATVVELLLRPDPLVVAGGIETAAAPRRDDPLSRSSVSCCARAPRGRGSLPWRRPTASWSR